MGLELLGDKSNQRGVESACLGRLVGDGCALCSVKGFCDGMRRSLISWRRCVVKTDSAMLVSCTMVRQEPSNDADPARLLCWLDDAVELVAVDRVGVPMGVDSAELRAGD